MNKRIKEIARKCKINVADTLPDGRPNAQCLVIEEFAKLIVDECCAIMDVYSTQRAGDVKNNVKEHFGIK